MTDTPPDWVLIEAAKRSNDLNENDDLEITIEYYGKSSIFRALCDMIERYEQPPVDRKLLCAREADRLYLAGALNEVEDVAVRAIELWEEGFGK